MTDYLNPTQFNLINETILVIMDQRMSSVLYNAISLTSKNNL